MPLTALQILRRDKANAAAFAERAGKTNTRRLLERAQLELNQRLARAEGLGGPGKDSFTANQMRAALAQVRAVLVPLQQGIQSAAVDIGRDSAEQGAGDTVEYIRRAEQEYRGSTRPLPFDTAAMVDEAVRGSNASVLRRLVGDPANPARPGILQRYGTNTIGLFEQAMQQRLIQGKSWAEARQDLVDASPFLQGKPAFWSERILRTESMFQHNAAGQQSLEQVHDAVGGMLKVLCATFDHRTGCLVGSTRVTGAVVRTIFRRRYQGQMVHIVTESGREFTTTPNHPMLTRRGWVGAHALDLSDQLVCDRWHEYSSAARDQHVADGPFTIAQLFEAAQFEMGVERYRGAEPDFHGDGRDGEVDVVHPRGLLGGGRLTPLFEPVTQGVFTPAGDPHRCPECGAVLGASAGELLDSTGVVPGCLTELLETNSYGRLRGAQRLCDDLQRLTTFVPGQHCMGVEVGAVASMLGAVALVPESLSRRVRATDPAFRQRLRDVAQVCGHRCRDLAQRETALVKLDRVVDVQVLLFDGHVFNLSTTDGYFTIDGAYTSNSDSIAVHGQVRRVSEAFQSWFGPYMHPPNRPNDREVVVPHNVAWALPDALKPRSDAEVAARWALEGRTGSPPPRPLMSTISPDDQSQQADQQPPMADQLEGQPPVGAPEPGQAPEASPTYSFPSPVDQPAEEGSYGPFEVRNPRYVVAHTHALFGRNLDGRDYQQLLGMTNELPGTKPEASLGSSSMAKVVTASVRWVDAEGKVQAELARSFRPGVDGKVAVKHALFVVDDAHKGNGFGSKVLADQLESYPKLGVSKVSLDAAWDGPYVWSRAGFHVADEQQWQRMQDRFADYLRTRPGLPPKAVEDLVANVRTAKDIAQTTHSGKKLGKDFLRDYFGAYGEMPHMELVVGTPAYQGALDYFRSRGNR